MTVTLKNIKDFSPNIQGFFLQIYFYSKNSADF